MPYGVPGKEIVYGKEADEHRLVGGDFAYVKLLDYYRGKDEKKHAYYRDLHKMYYNQT